MEGKFESHLAKLLIVIFLTIAIIIFVTPHTIALDGRELVRDTQAMLARAGYNPGPADGLMGPQTREAITKYQRAHNLTVTGTPSRRLHSHLSTNSGSSNGAGSSASGRGNRYCMQVAVVSGLGGAAVGAGIGNVLAKALGFDRKTGTIVGGIIGAIAGGSAGCKYGIHIAEKRNEFDTRSAQLDQGIADAARTQGDLAVLNKDLSSLLAERKKVIQSLSARRIRTKQDRDQKQALAKELNNNLQQLRQAETVTVSELQKHRQLVRETRGQITNSADAQKAKEYASNVRQLEAQYAKLTTLTQSYASASNQVSRL